MSQPTFTLEDVQEAFSDGMEAAVENIHEVFLYWEGPLTLDRINEALEEFVGWRGLEGIDLDSTNTYGIFDEGGELNVGSFGETLEELLGVS